MFDFYQENYVLPYYYTNSPNVSVYSQFQNDHIKNQEFKAQLSIFSPVIEWEEFSVNAAFSMKMYWQLYTSLPWVRSTDYAPEAFVLYKINNNFNTSIGYLHESNGVGNQYERSWDRIYGKTNFNYSDFSFEFMAWVIPTNEAVQYSNDKIENYLGYEKISASYKIWRFDSKISLQNIENYEKIQIVASENIALYNNFSLYFQYFYGYGQSLIEYNNFTQAFGVGIQFIGNDTKEKCKCE